MTLEEQQIVESQVGDYIRKNKLTQKQAMTGKHFAEIKRFAKLGDDRAKLAIDAVFNGKERVGSTKASSPKKPTKTPSSKPSKKPTKPGTKKPVKPTSKKPTKDDEEGEPAKPGTDVPPTEPTKPEPKPTSSGSDNAMQARKKAEGSPLKTPSFGHRIWMIHNGARNAAIKAIEEKMKKAKAGEGANIKVTNSAADDDTTSFDLSKTTYVIGIHIIMNNATISAMKKFAAFLSESTEYNGIVTEGLFDKGKAKVQAAVDAFRKELGVAAIQAYVAYFIGNRFVDSVTNDNVYAGVNDAGEMKGRMSFYMGVDASR